MSEATSIWTRLAEARKAATAIPKNGSNTEHGYSYVRAEDVIAKAEELLSDQGLVVLPAVNSAEPKYGRTGTLLQVCLEFEIVDVESGERITKPWIGYGFDSPGDKAIYKAITGATKYFLAGLLAMPFVGSDPEEDGSDEGGGSFTEELAADAERAAQDAAAEAPDSAPAEEVPA